MGAAPPAGERGGVRGLAVALLLLGALPALAAELPRYVAGPVSGLLHDCRQAGQRAPSAEAMVIAVDLDGDGRPDHVVDAARGCQAVRDLYCNAAGCTIDIYLSTLSGKALGLRVRGMAVDRGRRPARLLVTAGGSECGGSDAQECRGAIGWDGAALVVGPE